MNAPGALADALGQALLERRLSVLVGKLDVPVTPLMLIRQCAKSPREGSKVCGVEEHRRVQHLGMGDGGGDVVAHQARIKRVIFACRVAQHALIEAGILVPQETHARIVTCLP